MIRLDKVSKYFVTRSGRKHILRNVSLDIPRGLNVGLLGRNGVGKSTFMRLLAGVDTPNSGTISTSYNMSWPMGLAQGLQVTMTGRENARFVCRILGTPHDEVVEKLKFIEAFSEIGDYFDMQVRTYSSGMRARLNFAISMAFDFDCYLIDELTSVGDKGFREKSRQALVEKKGRSSFIKISHNLGELKAECDSGIILESGQLFFFQDVSEAVRCYDKYITQGKKYRHLTQSVWLIYRINYAFIFLVALPKMEVVIPKMTRRHIFMSSIQQKLNSRTLRNLPNSIALQNSLMGVNCL